MSDDTVDLDFEDMKVETERSKLYVIDGEEVWVPKSAIVDEAHGTVTVQRWLAKERGLI